MPKSAARPLGDDEAVALETDGTVIIPSVGDYVQIGNNMNPQNRVSFSCKIVLAFIPLHPGRQRGYLGREYRR